ncbi:MAG TPA: GntR family transcriptional regulator [Pseudolysinimonas sp.]|nr:GntR family transcriptional regulator [Pseudolysinimonas sp.]
MRPLDDGESLLDRVTASVRTAILSGEIERGARLSVPEIARQLNVSRTPAREALLRLQHEGLVEVTPRRGAVVLDGSVTDLKELFEFREALEGMAARRAALEMSDSARAALRLAFERHTQAVNDGDLAAHVKHDRTFHELFIAASGNSRIIKELERTRSLLRLLTQEMSAQPGALTPALVEAHSRIFNAIEARDPDAAEVAARKHVAGILRFHLEHDGGRLPLPADEIS